MYISLWENSHGHPDNVSFMQFSTKIGGFEQKDSQGFENSYNSYEQYPLEKFFIFTIYQNYTLALTWGIVLFKLFYYFLLYFYAFYYIFCILKLLSSKVAVSAKFCVFQYSSQIPWNVSVFHIAENWGLYCRPTQSYILKF